MDTITKMKKYRVYLDDLPVVYKLEIADGKIVATSIYDFKENRGKDFDECKNGFLSNYKKVIKKIFYKRPEEFEKIFNILTDVEMKNYCLSLKQL